MLSVPTGKKSVQMLVHLVAYRRQAGRRAGGQAGRQ